MAKEHATIIDLGRLSLSFGEAARMDIQVRLEPFELGGQAYATPAGGVGARLDVSRTSNGYAFRLRFPLRIEGPCMRCLEPAMVETQIDAREVEQSDTEDEELLSPYVSDDELDVGRWANDAAQLAIPSKVLCRPECAGLCPVCGASLNDADPADHEHGGGRDPRWDKLDELRSE